MEIGWIVLQRGRDEKIEEPHMLLLRTGMGTAPPGNNLAPPYDPTIPSYVYIPRNIYTAFLRDMYRTFGRYLTEKMGKAQRRLSYHNVILIPSERERNGMLVECPRLKGSSSPPGSPQAKSAVRGIPCFPAVGLS